jgi:hypothetical protein
MDPSKTLATSKQLVVAILWVTLVSSMSGTIEPQMLRGSAQTSYSPSSSGSLDQDFTHKRPKLSQFFQSRGAQIVQFFIHPLFSKIRRSGPGLPGYHNLAKREVTRVSTSLSSVCRWAKIRVSLLRLSCISLDKTLLDTVVQADWLTINPRQHSPFRHLPINTPGHSSKPRVSTETQHEPLFTFSFKF